MQQSPAHAFVHDDLGEHHDPCYFLQFSEWASQNGLMYLAETDLSTMKMAELPAETEPLLQNLAPEFLETQQWIDFLANRSGRSSILARNNAPVSRQLDPDAVRELSFALTRSVLNMPEKGNGFTLEDLPGVSTLFEGRIMKQIVRRLRDDSTEPVGFASSSRGTSSAEPESEDAVIDTLLHLLSGSSTDPVAPLP